MKHKKISIKVLMIQRLLFSITYFISSFMFWDIVYKHQSLVNFSIKEGVILFILLCLYQVSLMLGIESMYKEIDPINTLFSSKYKVVGLIQIGVLIINGLIVQTGNLSNLKYSICAAVKPHFIPDDFCKLFQSKSPVIKCGNDNDSKLFQS